MFLTDSGQIDTLISIIYCSHTDVLALETSAYNRQPPRVIMITGQRVFTDP